ncbi:ATP-binding cassette sub-family G member 1 [Trichonephila clavipes]|nr:ATP-binding cassette sub-family G member 1 [Trichonephila clavipes]
MFSDDFRFSLQSDYRRTLIWRAPGTRYHQESTFETTPLRWCKMARVWRGIILDSRTDLHVQSVTITGHIYRDVILEKHVRWFRGAMSAEFLFMDDNARPHHANIVDECLQLEDITRMDWPAYLPDFNPIEHVWDILGRRISAHQHPPTCLPELWRALLDEWCSIPQDQIDNLILSMPRLYCLYQVVAGFPGERHLTALLVFDALLLEKRLFKGLYAKCIYAPFCQGTGGNDRQMINAKNSTTGDD